MPYVVKINNGYLTIAKTSFECPACKQLYHEADYEKRLEKSMQQSKKGFIYKRCKNCKQWIGIAINYKGDVQVWLKSTETKMPIFNSIKT